MKLSATTIRRLALVLGAALVVLIVGIFAGGSADEPEGTTSGPTTTQTAGGGEEPLSTLPTPENIQTLVYERAFSECASYDVARLAGKYNVAVKSEENVALAVGEGWARQFSAGQDAVADGRDGCLQGFARG